MALRGDTTLRSSTISRVKHTAEQIGYRPDPALSALAAYRLSRASPRQLGGIALVVCDTAEHEWHRKPHASELVEAAHRQADSLGYSLQQFRLGEGPMLPARMDRILKARGIRGMIVAMAGGVELPEIDWSNYATVTIECPSGENRFNYVEANQYRAVFTCWEMLISHGYKRTGLVLDGGIDPNWLREWRAAYTSLAQHEAFGDVPTLCVDGPQAKIAIRDWLRRYKPDAVVNSSSAFYEACEEEGIAIPNDIGYVSLDTCADSRTDVTGIRQRWDVVGKSAVDILHSQLVRNSTGFQSAALGTSVCGNWVEGSTLPIYGWKASPKSFRSGSVERLKGLLRKEIA
jgi:DNA-binding LacI/PurR family transcriptional regulator